jgi:hypothetical protein
MPRVRVPGKLIRTPMPSWAAYEITYFYPPENDEAIIETFLPRLIKSDKVHLQFLVKVFKTDPTGRTLHPRQRLCLLEYAFPEDLRLKLIRERLTKEKTRFATDVREKPGLMYQSEKAAVEKAIFDRN